MAEVKAVVNKVKSDTLPLSNLAPVDHPVHPLIQQRRSGRAFSDKPLAPQDLLSLIEAARWAASSSNEQPWRFIVTTRADRPAFDRLLGCLVEANVQWARNAQALLLSMAQLNTDAHRPNFYAMHDVGQAAANLAIEGTALGLIVHQMAGFDKNKARAEFSIPAGYEPMATIAIGYPADTGSLPEELRQRELAPRVRKPLSEIAFGSTWGEASSLLK